MLSMLENRYLIQCLDIIHEIYKIQLYNALYILLRNPKVIVDILQRNM